MQGIDLKGRKFGYWNVLDGPQTISNHTMWLCRCVCGAELSRITGHDNHTCARKIREGMTGDEIANYKRRA